MMSRMQKAVTFRECVWFIGTSVTFIYQCGFFFESTSYKNDVHDILQTNYVKGLGTQILTSKDTEKLPNPSEKSQIRG